METIEITDNLAEAPNYDLVLQPTTISAISSTKIAVKAKAKRSFVNKQVL
jgi:hypothetical protein